MIFRLMFFVVSWIVLLPIGVPPASASEISRPLTFSGPQFQIEDLTADVHSDGRVLVVQGKIKNLGFSSVQGFITVYFKGSHHEVLNAIDADVNNRQPIPSGQSGKFEASANVQNLPGLSNVSVEFTETARALPYTKN